MKLWSHCERAGGWIFTEFWLFMTYRLRVHWGHEADWATPIAERVPAVTAGAWMCQTWWSCSRCAEELFFFVWFPWPLHRCLHSWTLELHGFVLLMRCLCSWQIPNLCQKHASFGGFQCPIPLTQECEDARSKLSDVRNRVEASRFQFLEPNCFRKERVLSGLLIRALKQPCLKDLGRNQVSHSITLWKGKLQGQTHIA